MQVRKCWDLIEKWRKCVVWHVPIRSTCNTVVLRIYVVYKTGALYRTTSTVTNLENSSVNRWGHRKWYIIYYWSQLSDYYSNIQRNCIFFIYNKKIGRNYFSIVQRDAGLQGFLYINKQGEKKGFYRQNRNTKTT